eukprot:TRINITY_DN3618_c0_g1_i1.p1 TRINITY_DN3618_c0_g1~~TRINITY_DN3618_c0_g1_i1.p1  ORF type:complete len:323 (+),score=97.96 TRINITY_DN3618_c0_g1_i1:362-1330(+)
MDRHTVTEIPLMQLGRRRPDHAGESELGAVEVVVEGAPRDPRGPFAPASEMRSSGSSGDGMEESLSPSAASVRFSEHTASTPRGGGIPHAADTDVMVIENERWKSWIPLSTLACVSVVVGLAVAFSLPSGEQWLVRYTICIVLMVNAVVMAFNAKSERYVFDSNQGKLVITTKRVVGVTVRQYWLYEIRDVQVQEYFDPQGGTDYELYLYIRSGSRVKLFSGHIIGVGWHKKMRTREEIKAFLNAFSKRYRARSSASHSSFRQYLKRRHFSSAQNFAAEAAGAAEAAEAVQESNPSPSQATRPSSPSSPYSSPARTRPPGGN